MMPRRCFPLRVLEATAAVLLCLAALGRAADVALYTMSKGLVNVQTNDGPPAAAIAPYAYQAQAFLTPSNTIYYSVSSPNADTFGSSNGVQSSLSMPGSNLLDLAGTYFSQTTLDNFFPATNYLYALTLVGGAVTNLYLPLLPGAGPAAPPQVTNFTAAQSVDPSMPFTVGWNAFADGTTNDVIELQIINCTTNFFDSGLPYAFNGSLDGTATGMTIPAGTLLPGSSYVGRLTFEKVVYNTNSPVPALAGYFQRTEFSLMTTGAVPFALVSVTPTPGSTNVAADAPLVFTFNRASRLSSGIEGIHFTNSFRTSWSADHQAFTITPTSRWSTNPVSIYFNPAGGGSLGELYFGDASGNPLLPDTLAIQFTAGTNLSPPTVTGPANVAALAGSNATFTVTVGGLGTHGYQWLFNGNPILSATNISLTLTNVQAVNAGNYSVVVTNISAGVTSQPAILLVNEPLAIFTPTNQAPTFPFQLGGVTPDGMGNVYYSASGLWKILPADVVTAVPTVPSPFVNPRGLSMDNAGNLFVAEFFRNAIYEVTPDGQARLVAGGGLGSADGTNGAAQFNSPRDVIVDKSSGTLYVSDNHNNTIREIVPQGTNWVVTTIAGYAGAMGSTDGVGTNATFNQPSGMGMDSAGNIYVADYVGRVVRQLSPVGTNWMVTTIAGLPGFFGIVDGTGSGARFMLPSGIAVDGADNVYVGDSSCIRKITLVGTNWIVDTVAGTPGSGLADGIGASARLAGVTDMRFDASGTLYLADRNNGLVRVGVPYHGQPIVTLPPLGRMSYAGTNVLLRVAVMGSPPLSFQWVLNGTNLTDGGGISGSQTNILNIAGVLPQYAGNFQLIVSNAFGCVTTIVANVSLTLPPLKTAGLHTAGNAMFSWQAFSNVTYQVQYKTNLLQTDWSNLGAPFTTNSGTASFQDGTVTDAQRFYRVELSQ